MQKYIIYVNGGGWCYDYKECAARALTSLGSSKFWPKTQGVWGFMSDDNATNPYFASWNGAFCLIFRLCDSAYVF